VPSAERHHFERFNRLTAAPVPADLTRTRRAVLLGFRMCVLSLGNVLYVRLLVAAFTGIQISDGRFGPAEWLVLADKDHLSIFD
jgi:hypothetical protein